MDDLVAFLRARLAEDQAAAEAARDANSGDAEWVAEATEGIWTRPSGIQVAAGGIYLGDVEAEHMARHDPARVLREIDAKRELLRLAAQSRKNAALPAETPGGLSGAGFFVKGFAAAMEHTLRLLAAAYADHPDYRPEWAPAS